MADGTAQGTARQPRRSVEGRPGSPMPSRPRRLALINGAADVRRPAGGTRHGSGTARPARLALHGTAHGTEWQTARHAALHSSRTMVTVVCRTRSNRAGLWKEALHPPRRRAPPPFNPRSTHSPRRRPRHGTESPAVYVSSRRPVKGRPEFGGGGHDF
jgi:hypothetical protein